MAGFVYVGKRWGTGWDGTEASVGPVTGRVRAGCVQASRGCLREVARGGRERAPASAVRACGRQLPADAPRDGLGRNLVRACPAGPANRAPGMCSCARPCACAGCPGEGSMSGAWVGPLRRTTSGLGDYRRLIPRGRRCGSGRRGEPPGPPAFRARASLLLGRFPVCRAAGAQAPNGRPPRRALPFDPVIPRVRQGSWARRPLPRIPPAPPPLFFHGPRLPLGVRPSGAAYARASPVPLGTAPALGRSGSRGVGGPVGRIRVPFRGACRRRRRVPPPDQPHSSR